MPINALLYSDPTLFEVNLKDIFRTLMETGLGRRCMITFMPKNETFEMEPDPKKARVDEQNYYKSLKYLGGQLYKIFDLIPKNATYELKEETFEKVFYPYKKRLKESADKEEDSLLIKEIISRELKALKISCLYACINHHDDYFIYPEDMRQAIETVEVLSDGLRKFENYKPEYKDKYDRGFDFFLENEGTSFKKHELITKHYQCFGLSRDKFKDNFDRYIDTIKEIATSKGYFLNEVPINHNSGVEYKLIRLKAQELSDYIIPLDELLNN